MQLLLHLLKNLLGLGLIVAGILLSVPGIENLTGHIKGSEKQGVITLATKDAWLIAPDLFREVLPVKRLQGILDWQQAENAWSVSSPMVELDSCT